jgi:hypothetical protein
MENHVILIVWGLTLGFMVVFVIAPVSLYARFLAIRRERRKQVSSSAVVPVGSTIADDDEGEPERNLLLDFEDNGAQVRTA